MKRFFKPNWKKSNLNISATLAEFLNAPNKNATLKILKNELVKEYKNVVFVCMDGLGINPIKINLNKNDFLRKNVKQTLMSTFPSTTTNATTSLACNLLPLEHGWLGWNLYFEEINQNIDIYLRSNPLTGQTTDFVYPITNNGNCYFDNANSDYEITPILPIYVQTKSQNKIVIKDEFEMCSAIKNVCQKEGKQFIYAYLPEPDATMHDFGVSSKEAKQKIASINAEFEKLQSELNNTLLIITADHGQIDIADYVEFYKDEELNGMLKCPPFLDARTPAFIVKPGMHKKFEIKFKQKYGKDFKLFKSQDLIKKGYFGNQGKYGYLLGDYIAVGTYTHKQFLMFEKSPRFKGHHTSLTEEMLVPLIIIGKK